MQSYRRRFDAMVAALREHPEVEIYELEIRPPAREAELREAEAALGMPLPADLRRFYAEQDGLFLEWGLRGAEYSYRTDPFGWPDYGSPPCCINLLPVSDAMSSEWATDYHVNEVSPEHQQLLFGAVVEPPPPFDAVCIDNFSKYNHADLILGPEPVVIVSTDHGADMEASDFCSFSTYFELTIAIYGTNRYTNGLGIGWSREPRRVEAWTQRASLDELIAKLREK